MPFRRYVHPAAVLLLLSSLLALALWPENIDLRVAGWFFDPALDRFPARGAAVPEALHAAIGVAGKSLAVVFAIALISCLLARRALVGIDAQAWAFLLCCLLTGPLLVSNLVLKNHWGRARPVQVQEFGGTRQFTPPLLPSSQCQRNCSFVAGDPSVVFILHALAYLAATRRRRLWLFWGSLAAGGMAGALRIWMGAHFLSDVVFAAVFMLAAGALCHAAFFGGRNTLAWWRDWWRMR